MTLPKISLLDFKLGARMLVRYPGLTIVSTLAMAFAIALGLAYHAGITQLISPKLPLPDGDGVVAVRSWDAEAGVPYVTVQELDAWRTGVPSLDDIGGYRTIRRNLATADGRSAPISIAEMNASGFRVARVAPLLGRHLVAEDEVQGAPAVVVIGYDVWQERFGGSPDVVGAATELDGVPATVVGVMPDGFAFPVSHAAWTPLRASGGGAADARPLTRVFARIGGAGDWERVSAELAVVGQRLIAEQPSTYQHRRWEIVSWPKSILQVTGAMSVAFMASNLIMVMFLVLVCSTVALLMYARTATRESEIIVRNALGASRGRIVGQLFAEALVLAAVAAALGIVTAQEVMERAMSVMVALEGTPPFWFTDRMSLSTLVYACVLTLLGAVVTGVLPAMRMTGRDAEARVRSTTASIAGYRFGGVWTAVIVTQIAFTVAAPAHLVNVMRTMTSMRTSTGGLPSREYLTARLELDTVASATRAGSADILRKLEAQLSVDPGVRAITYASTWPGATLRRVPIQLEAAGSAPGDTSSAGPWAGSASVAANFTHVMGLETLAGRSFMPADAVDDTRVVVVNESFARHVLGGQNAIGRRIRYVEGRDGDDRNGTEPQEWFTIIGVVADLGAPNELEPLRSVAIYHPADAEQAFPMQLLVHTRTNPGELVGSLITGARSADPALRVHDAKPLSAIHDAELQWNRFLFRTTLLVGMLALTLSLSGIYAVMSFTVSRRTREIGIRMALGSGSRSIITTIFRRPFAQVSMGVAAGGLLAVFVAFVDASAALWPTGALLCAAYSVLMLGVCMLSCIVPTRRALRVQPTEALREG